MKPTIPPIDSADHRFHDGDDATQRDGTDVTSVFMNDVQDAVISMQSEINTVLTDAGIAPDPALVNQLKAGITKTVEMNLTKIAKAVQFVLSPTIPAPTADANPSTKKYTDDAVKAAQTDYVGHAWWHPAPSKLPGGTILGSGQVITTAKVLHPELVAAVQAGDLPGTTEATWQAQPTARGAYVYDAVADTLRVPDYNGAQPGSILAPVFRGNGGGLAGGSMQENGVPNAKFWFNARRGSSTIGAVTNADDVVMKLTPSGSDPATQFAPITTGSGTPTTDRVDVDLSRASSVYQDGLTEARMNSVVGCYVIRVAMVAANSGSVDMLQLQADLAALKASVESFNNKIGYALVDVPGIPALGSRTVVNNPFGNNTPVVCWAEVFHPALNKWVNSCWTWNASGNTTYGVEAFYLEGDGIAVAVGRTAYAVNSTSNNGASVDVGTNLTTTTGIRIHVISVGKDISKLKQISQIDPALIQEFKAPVNPTGIRKVWAKTDTETGGQGTVCTLSESVLGKTIYVPTSDTNKFAKVVSIPPAMIPEIVSSTVVGGIPIGHTAIFVDTSYRISISPDGKSLKLISFATGAAAWLAIYVADYSVQP